MSINETYIPQKGCEKLFETLMQDYRRELQAILKEECEDTRHSMYQRKGENFKGWMDRTVAASTARIDALDERFKPPFRALADAIIQKKA